jgi:hypothetical protein
MQYFQILYQDDKFGVNVKFLTKHINLIKLFIYFLPKWNDLSNIFP